jgi:Skp family chaperone for outer membrane proteins
MFRPKSSMRAMMLAAALICSLFTAPGAHAQDKSGGIKIATVDGNKLAQEYKYTQTAMAELQKFNQDVVTELNSWDQHRYLEEADQRKLGLIAVKEANKTELTKDEKDLKTKLEDASKRLFDEYLALQTKQNAAPAEVDRLKALTRMEGDTQKRIKDRQAAGQEELSKRDADMRKKISADVKTAIGKVAKAKGVNVVFSSDVAYYCDVDLTEDVLKDLNSGK